MRKPYILVPLLGALCAALVATSIPAQADPTTDAGAGTASPDVLVALSLVNGWTDAPFSTSNAAVKIVDGVVHFKGAIATSGTSPVPFTLPVAYRPKKNVYVNVDLCSATKGRLFIPPSGVVTVQAETDFANAQCFTSLDGASFVRDGGPNITTLTLINGWTGGGFGTGNPAVESSNGVVHLKGSIETTGTDVQPFKLPTAFRPTTDVYTSLDLCNAAKGRLYIQPSGNVFVEAENDFTSAQCFTSLDGVTFSKGTGSFTALPPINGWAGAPYATSPSAIVLQNGIVTFKGAISTSGTNSVAFTLPAAYRPLTNVYVPVDMCNATNGRLIIENDGTVIVQAETDFSNAECFTSLEGVSFAR